MPSDSDYRNSLALAEEIRRLREDYSTRIAVMENTIRMQGTMIRQLQDLFAMQTVVRGSGPTVGV